MKEDVFLCILALYFGVIAFILQFYLLNYCSNKYLFTPYSVPGQINCSENGLIYLAIFFLQVNSISFKPCWATYIISTVTMKTLHRKWILLTLIWVFEKKKEFSYLDVKYFDFYILCFKNSSWSMTSKSNHFETPYKQLVSNHLELSETTVLQ